MTRLKLTEMIEKAQSFGAAAHAIRLRKNLSQKDLGDLCRLDESNIRDIERNLALGTPDFVTTFGRVLGLSEAEREALAERRAREVAITAANRRGECTQCAAGETGWMHVGAGPRHDECRNVNRCLNFITRHFPTATACHCPKKCAGLDEISNEERRADAVARARKGFGEAA